jgi:AraC-like DNA-binding protein
MMGMLFHYEDAFVDVTLGGCEALPRATLNGQRTGPIDVRATGKTGILLVTFYPWGASAFLPGSMAELADRNTDLADLLERDVVERVADRIQEARDADERFAFVEAFLLERLGAERRDELVVASALKLQTPRRDMSALAAASGLSRRQWIRRFQSSIGLGPKSFARILRFQRATALKRSGKNWGEVCLECGYYDQAHLTREFRELAGCSFEAFAPRNTPLMKTFNEGGPMSLLYKTIYL